MTTVCPARTPAAEAMALGVPVVTTLHDLSVLLHPQWHSSERVAYFERYFHKGMARCVHALAVSEFGRQEIIRVLGLRPDQVHFSVGAVLGGEDEREGVIEIPCGRRVIVLRNPSALRHMDSGNTDANETSALRLCA